LLNNGVVNRDLTILDVFIANDFLANTHARELVKLSHRDIFDMVGGKKSLFKILNKL